MHSIRLVSPRLEVILVNSKLLREGLDVRRVFIAEDLSGQDD